MGNAIGKGNTEVVQYLLSYGADPKLITKNDLNSTDEKTLEIVGSLVNEEILFEATTGWLDKIHKLPLSLYALKFLKSKEYINELLYRACFNYVNLPFVELIVKQHKPDMNYISQWSSGRTVLATAIRYESWNIAKYLIAHGADVDAKMNGRTISDIFPKSTLDKLNERISHTKQAIYSIGDELEGGRIVSIKNAEALVMAPKEYFDYDVRFGVANSYCDNLIIDNHGGWRLPYKEDVISLQGSGLLDDETYWSNEIYTTTQCYVFGKHFYYPEHRSRKFGVIPVKTVKI